MEDVLIDTDGDLLFTKGDFKIGDSTLQNQRLLLLYQKGEMKEHPVAGVAASTYLHDENIDDLYREVRREFVQDGMLIKTLDINSQQLKVEASYE